MHVSTPAVSAAIGAAGKGINVRVPIIRCQYAGHTTLSSGFGVMYPVSYWPHLGSCGTHLNYFSHPPNKQKPLELRAGPAFFVHGKICHCIFCGTPERWNKRELGRGTLTDRVRQTWRLRNELPTSIIRTSLENTAEASAVDKPGHPIPRIPLQQVGATCWHDSSDRGIRSNASSLPYTARCNASLVLEDAVTQVLDAGVDLARDELNHGSSSLYFSMACGLQLPVVSDSGCPSRTLCPLSQLFDPPLGGIPPNDDPAPQS